MGGLQCGTSLSNSKMICSTAISCTRRIKPVSGFNRTLSQWTSSEQGNAEHSGPADWAASQRRVCVGSIYLFPLGRQPRVVFAFDSGCALWMLATLKALSLLQFVFLFTHTAHRGGGHTHTHTHLRSHFHILFFTLVSLMPGVWRPSTPGLLSSEEASSELISLKSLPGREVKYLQVSSTNSRCLGYVIFVFFLGKAWIENLHINYSLKCIQCRITCCSPSVQPTCYYLFSKVHVWQCAYLNFFGHYASLSLYVSFTTFLP